MRSRNVLLLLLLLASTSSIAHKKRFATSDFTIRKSAINSFTGLPYGETPASLACVYGLTTPVANCNLYNASEVPSGGWGAIALVDGYYNPYAQSDLQTYATKFNYPNTPDFHQVFAYASSTGRKGSDACNGPQPLQGWWDEQVIDIEMAFSMAPKAKIYLVEAQSGETPDLLTAVSCATSLVQGAGGGIISMSWSVPEYREETNDDVYFQNDKVVYIGSAGDYSKPARYPSASPHVISAGGTTIVRDAAGNFIQETAWSTDPNTPPGGKSGGSGGPSLYESRPAYQNIVQRIVGNKRGTPDIAAIANLSSGVVVYSTYSGGWITTGGTSAASPILAGIINSANHRAKSTQDELTYIYSFYPKAYHSFWNDIVVGNNGYSAMQGYDFATGLGSPHTYGGK